jgi:hypothetical protein
MDTSNDLLSRSSIEQRKAKLAKLVRGPHPGIVLNEHYECDGLKREEED